MLDPTARDGGAARRAGGAAQHQEARRRASTCSITTLTRVVAARTVRPTPGCWRWRTTGRVSSSTRRSNRTPKRHFGLRFMRERAPARRSATGDRVGPGHGNDRSTGDSSQGRGVERRWRWATPGADRRRGGPDRRNPDAKVKILLVDDHALFRVGMRQILEREADFEIVAEAEDPRGAFDAAQTHSARTSSCSTSPSRRRAASRRRSASSARCPPPRSSPWP